MKKEKPDIYTYLLPGGWEILAGKTDSDNDMLSFKVAGPNDYWFHVRGMPGSHVILVADKKEDPGKEILESAAAIAAYHSKARKGGVVPVTCTRARYVTKPRGAKPGSVHVRREKLIKIRPGLPEPHQ
ncbi:MAG: DUF814 domain-containing protein [Deltaproteobacteria bacterium]|nr:DUF814 domain-containing protein [Deltaproteobacteria bacterium]